MTTTLKFRRGTTSDNDALVLEEGEIFVDTDKYTLVVHDGARQGGTALASEDFVFSTTSGIVGNPPNSLNTLEEIANAINNDSDFANTVQLAVDSKIQLTDLSAAGDLNYNSATGTFSITNYKTTDFDSDFSNKSTSDLAEGSNLYYLDSRVDAHLSSGTGVSYSSGTISIGQSVEQTDDVVFNSVTLAQSPSSSSDATTKSYVDSVAQGIVVRPSSRAATTDTLDASYSAGTLTSNNTGEFTTDGVVDWEIGERVIVKDQVDLTQNGVYQVTAVGGTSTAYQLERVDFMDESSEVAGSFVYVREGTNNAGTSWAFSVDDPSTFILDTDDIEAYQFSKAGEFTDGAGLSLDGTAFSVNIGEGLTISSDIVQLSSQVAGTGLDYDAGVLSVRLSDLSTTELTEGDNLYFTIARANGAIDQRVGKAFVDNLAVDAAALDGEDGNFYLNYDNFTNTPSALSQFNNDSNYIKLTDLSAAGDITYNSTTGEFIVTNYKTTDFNADFDAKTSDDLTEGSTNLYYSESRVDSYLSAGTGVSYNQGEISIGQPVDPTDDVTFNQIVANGGIVFGGDISAKTTLNDYEEGSWLPEFDSANAGTDRVTSVLFGTYTKVGRLVYCDFSAEMSSLGSGGSGQFIIRGLPFTGTGAGSLNIIYFENLATPITYMSGVVQAGAGRVLVSVLTEAGTSMNQAPQFDDLVQQGTRIDGTIVYSVE